MQTVLQGSVGTEPVPTLITLTDWPQNAYSLTVQRRQNAHHVPSLYMVLQKSPPETGKMLLFTAPLVQNTPPINTMVCTIFYTRLYQHPQGQTSKDRTIQKTL